MVDPIFIIGGSVAVIGGGIYLAWLYEKKRSEAFQHYAAQHDWTFEKNGHGRLEEVSHFKLFNQGHGRRLTNVVLGAKDGAFVSIGDYRYTVGSGKSSRTYNQTVCAVRVPGLDLPHFFARRQLLLFDDLGRLFGGQDLNFDEDPEFSKAYVLQTQGNEARVRQYFNQRARNAFTELARKSPQVEGHGEALLLHFGKRLGVDELDGLVADAVNLVRCWPRG